MKNAKEYSLKDISYSDSSYLLLDKMRDECPIYWSEKDKCWILTRYTDIFHVSTSPLYIRSNAIQAENFLIKKYKYISAFIENNSMNSSDTQHKLYRDHMMNILFKNTLSVEKIVDEAAKRTFTKVDSQATFKISQNFLEPILEEFLSNWFGIALEDAQKINNLLKQLTPFIKKETDPDMRSETMMKEIYHCLVNYIEGTKPCGSILRSYIEERHKQASITHIFSNLLNVIIPLFITTKIQFSNIVYGLLSRPSLYKTLHENHASINSFSLYELIRYFPAILFVTRFSTQDQTFHNISIKKGDQLKLMVASANRDPDIFQCPRKIDLECEDFKKVLTFGIGIYSCSGKKIFLDILHKTIASLISSFSHLECLYSFGIKPSGGFWGYDDLEVHGNLIAMELKE
ncbi:MAG: cytochrome p450 [Gammaproteobacteria bacterium]|nr:cytochrome p450 [Gammaproteobacteria bacterium]